MHNGSISYIDTENLDNFDRIFNGFSKRFLLEVRRFDVKRLVEIILCKIVVSVNFCKGSLNLNTTNSSMLRQFHKSLISEKGVPIYDLEKIISQMTYLFSDGGTEVSTISILLSSMEQKHVLKEYKLALLPI